MSRLQNSTMDIIKNKKGFELSIDFIVRLIPILILFLLGLYLLAKWIGFFS